VSLTKLSAHGKGPDADPGLFGGEDRLYGNGGADNFVGGAGNDRLFGGDGNDIPPRPTAKKTKSLMMLGQISPTPMHRRSP